MSSSPDRGEGPAHGPAPLSPNPALAIEDERTGLRLRRAHPGDIGFLVELIAHPDVEPFLAAITPSTDDELRVEIQRSREEPTYFGRLVAERTVREDEPVGSLAYEVANRRSRIAYLSALAIAPEHAGQGLGVALARLGIAYVMDEIGYHRVQSEIYAFNERAVHVAERAGLTREGVRRSAYWRRGGWVDAILLGRVSEDPPL